ncbi:MAG: hypothetical protein AABX04_05325 [Nanoarchaeota archaeon]
MFLACCNKNPTLSAEHTTYVWASLDKAKMLMKFKEKQLVLDEAITFLRRSKQ